MRAACSLVVAALAAPTARADTLAGAASAPAPAARVEPARESTEPTQHVARGLAVGAEVGDPIAATVGWFTGPLALLGAIGSGTREGPGLSLHADAQLVVTRLRQDVPLRVGIGARFYHHGYPPASVDEIPDDHFGIRASAALGLERGRFQIYAEVAPGLDIRRSASCSLMSGPRSVCPHSQASPLFLQLVVGARWFISH